MFNSKELRVQLTTQIKNALTAAGITGYSVSHAVDKGGSARYVVFAVQDLISWDGRNSMELEMNVVGPASDSDGVEKAADAVWNALNQTVTIDTNIAYYIYRSTRNRMDGSDPHTVRYRVTFELYLYERN